MGERENKSQIETRPVGPEPNVSPARKGWETDDQDCGAPEARHNIHLPVPRLRRSDDVENDVPALPGWADVWFRPYGPGFDLKSVLAFSRRAKALRIPGLSGMTEAVP